MAYIGWDQIVWEIRSTASIDALEVGTPVRSGIQMVLSNGHSQFGVSELLSGPLLKSSNSRAIVSEGVILSGFDQQRSSYVGGTLNQGTHPSSIVSNQQSAKVLHLIHTEV